MSAVPHPLPLPQVRRLRTLLRTGMLSRTISRCHLPFTAMNTSSVTYAPCMTRCCIACTLAPAATFSNLQVRRLRTLLRTGKLSRTDYERLVDQQVAFAIGVQEAVGLDVLVHGEPERTDMVEYFGVQLGGLAFTLQVRECGQYSDNTKRLNSVLRFCCGVLALCSWEDWPSRCR
jgi:hypothetical protein